MRTRRLTLLLAAAALVGCGTVPTNTAGVAPQTTAPPSDLDKTWLRTIHQGNMAEVQAGRLAEAKGTTKQVKSIGKMLVDDHTALDVKVTQLAGRLGVDLPTSPTADQKELSTKLREDTGADFDQDFVAGMTKAHTAAIRATKQQIDKGTSQEVVALAKEAEPQLKEHLAALRKAHGG
ncbi:hypothetical protein Nocox_18175 [Nonomuraea coxensis DSM 45129]|uniref:DUF4142 domain-containing protein n=1 Tax=Nonomuraea coxensis DSM 45129 TaxID=1122611 RepID=A0ABX8U297_9ACTN|nr:DUF4142 domain-containing protein [Nonomuraea coxensis]QYC41244.1 hypothetical protein Nocox_18175 [Nonomuraea coxensis DSM 45129]